MNRTMLKRLLWKEYRQYRGLLIVAVGFAAVAFGLVMLVAAAQGRSVDSEAMFLIALGAALVYALGCSATTFAAEHDHGTFDFLCLLPQPPRMQVLAKGVFVLASTVALAIVLALAAFALLGGRVARSGSEIQWKQLVLAIFETIAWGCLFSQRLRHPLVAVVATVAAVAIVPLVVLRGGVPMIAPEVAPETTLIVVRIVVIGMLFTYDAWLGRHWFYDTIFRPLTDSPLAAPISAGESPRRCPPFVVATCRLVWQEWRHSRWLITLTLGTPLAFWGIAVLASRLQSAGPPTSAIPLALLPVVAAVAGSSAFFGDQWKHRYRFFAEHGVSARQVWWSRLLVWGSAVAGWAVLAVVIYAIAALRGHEPTAWRWTSAPYTGIPARDNSLLAAEISAQTLLLPWNMSRLALATYACGQMSSMFLRSGVLGFFGGLIASWFVGGWAYFSGSVLI